MQLNKEIHDAYKEQISLNHPDKVSHLSKDLQDFAKRRTQDIIRACDLLKHR